MATVKDIAKMTGYSISTVSKALNGYEDISDAAKNEIIKVAESLNYYPDYKLKNLKKRDNKSIAFIVNGLNARSDGSTILQDLMSGIFRYASSQNIDMVVYTTDRNKQDQISYYQFCKGNNIDGAILLGIALDDPYYLELAESNLPFVMIDVLADNPSERIGEVTVDNVGAARDATNYLIQMGHQNICFVNGKRMSDVAIKREEGFRMAMEAKGFEVDESRILYADFDFDKACNEVMRVLQTNRDVTAFFCASDIMAMGVYEACNRLDVKIPDQISVVGFDGLPLTSYVNPKLTTVQQDMYLMGERAAEHLRDIIYKQANGIVINMPYSLVIRDSVQKLY